MEQWTTYHRKGVAEARPYIPGEDLSAVSVSATDIPNTGGMIFRNPDNHADQWYVAEAWFKANYTGASRLASLKAFAEAVREVAGDIDHQGDSAPYGIEPGCHNGCPRCIIDAALAKLDAAKKEGEDAFRNNQG